MRLPCLSDDCFDVDKIRNSVCIIYAVLPVRRARILCLYHCTHACGVLLHLTYSVVVARHMIWMKEEVEHAHVVPFDMMRRKVTTGLVQSTCLLNPWSKTGIPSIEFGSIPRSILRSIFHTLEFIRNRNHSHTPCDLSGKNCD